MFQHFHCLHWMKQMGQKKKVAPIHPRKFPILLKHNRFRGNVEYKFRLCTEILTDICLLVHDFEAWKQWLNHCKLSLANQTQRPMWGQIHSLMNYILTNNFSRKYTFLKNCYSDRYIILYISLNFFNFYFIEFAKSVLIFYTYRYRIFF